MEIKPLVLTMESFISLLKEDIAREWAHMHFYLASSIQVCGLHRAEYKEWLEDKANEEMTHVKEWGKMLLGLGEQTVPSCPDRYPADLCGVTSILTAALELEKEVVQQFCERKSQAEAIASLSTDPDEVANATYVALFLEDQILDSKGDVDEIRMLLRSTNGLG